MHVALIIDDQRLGREQSMLNRLCIGLMAEGVRLTRIVPENLDPALTAEGERRIALASRFEANFRVLPWMRSLRTTRLVEELEDAPPDVIYAVGARSWSLAADLAQALERPLLMDVYSVEAARQVPKPADVPAIAGYVAPCGGIEVQLRQRVSAGHIDVVPMGVAVPAQPRQVLMDADAAPALAILGSASDVQGYRPLIAALKAVVKRKPNIQLFLELSGPAEHEIWREADRAGLLGQISALGDATGYRGLVTRCDGVVMARADGELRSIMLEAMACQIPILSPKNEALDMLRDNETAWQTDGASAASWEAQICRLLDQPEQARDLGARERAFVAKAHRSSWHVARLLETLQRAHGGDSFRLPRPEA